MPPTLDYGLKECMAELTKDGRWNVLSVLILHANIRNRCWVGMDTIAAMATNNSPRKATKAKKWLQDHGAFTLVPFDKRVEQELDLPARQHVYQLTGTVTIDGTVYNYLYHGKTDVSPIGNIREDNVSPIDNNKESVVSPIEIINGGNLSISNISNSSPRKPAKVTDHTTAMAKELIQTWVDAHGLMGSFDSRRRMAHAKEMLSWPLPPTSDEIRETTLERLKIPRKGIYEFVYLIDDIKERRALAEYARAQAKRKEAESKTAVEKAEFHIAMTLGSQEYDNGTAA